MTDIVERLRWPTLPPFAALRHDDFAALRHEAAAEIEKLRSALGDLVSWMDEWTGRSLRVSETADNAMEAIEAARAALAPAPSEGKP